MRGGEAGKEVQRDREWENGREGVWMPGKGEGEGGKVRKVKRGGEEK